MTTPTTTAKQTVKMVFSTRNGLISQDWELVKVTRCFAVIRCPTWTPGSTGRYRLEDGLRAGMWLASLDWKVAHEELPRLRALAAQVKK